jgi:hypothetical protein
MEQQDLFPIPLDQASTQQALAALGDIVPPSGVMFLSFGKDGTWRYGRDQDELTPEDRLAVNPASFQVGWIGWEDGKVVDEIMVPITARASLPSLSSLPAIKSGTTNGWLTQLSVQMKMLPNEMLGDTESIDMKYSTTSHGGKRALADLSKAILRDMGAQRVIPVVACGRDSYKHRQYGTIQIPTFTVVGWLDTAGKPVK